MAAYTQVERFEVDPGLRNQTQYTYFWADEEGIRCTPVSAGLLGNHRILGAFTPSAIQFYTKYAINVHETISGYMVDSAARAANAAYGDRKRTITAVAYDDHKLPEPGFVTYAWKFGVWRRVIDAI